MIWKIFVKWCDLFKGNYEMSSCVYLSSVVIGILGNLFFYFIEITHPSNGEIIFVTFIMPILWALPFFVIEWITKNLKNAEW